MDLPRNEFKRQLARPGVTYGLFSGLVDPAAAEVISGAGFDWMLIDGEHAPHDLRSILTQLQAAAAHDTPVLVRAETGDTVLIKRLLDLSVLMLLIPMVESADQAAQIVAAARYPPAGVRGVATAVNRAARWGMIDDYLSRADGEICVVCQIESVAGTEAIESIGAVDGVDALFVGPSDLAASMGLIGRPGHPDVVAAVDDAITRIVDAGLPAGVFATNPELAARWTALGATFVAVGADIALLAKAATDLADRCRSE